MCWDREAGDLGWSSSDIGCMVAGLILDFHWIFAQTHVSV
jgi:hypothetical protein